MKNKLKDFFLNNWSLKLLSLVLAAIIWMIIVNYDNPYMTRTISGIPIEFVNEETLTDNNMVYSVDNTQTASIRVRCPRKTAQRLKASDFKAEADFSDMYTLTNQVPISITSSNASVTSDEITILTPSVQIDIEEIQVRKLEVNVALVGEPVSGYQVGDTSCSPSAVTVRAPQSFLDQISYVGVEVNVDGISQSFTKSAALQFYNAGGNPIDLTDVKALTVSTRDINVEVEILNVKTVNLEYTVTGQDAVAEGYLYAGIEVDPSTFEISGRKSILADISALRIPEGELDVSGADSNLEKTFDARELLPDGVSLVNDEDYTINVTLKIERLTTKEFSLNTSQIKIQNLREDRELEFLSESLDVTIQGLNSDLNALSAGELEAVVNLENAALGDHYVYVDLIVPHGFSVIGTPRIYLKLTTKPVVSEETTVAAKGAEERTTESAADRN